MKETLSKEKLRLTNFGAFVDIGGVDGLVHVSELSHEHVQSPEDVVSVGQEVDVKVKSVEKILNVFLYLLKILYQLHSKY